MKMVYVGFRFDHHGPHAGYDKIRFHVPYEQIEDLQTSFAFRSRRFSSSVLQAVFNRIFGGRMWWEELRLIVGAMLAREQRCYHLIYPENMYRFLGRFKGRHKVVLTVHQPEDYFNRPEQAAFLRACDYADDIIALTPDSRDYFKARLKKARVHFVPHGVDTDFFLPGETRGATILMVGGWLRDFEFARTVFDLLKKRRPDIPVVVVTSPANFRYFEGCRIQLRNGLTDEQLLAEYRNAGLLFLPLIRFTANNAVLEALSTGVPVLVATSHAEARASSTLPVHFEPFDAEKVVEAIVRLLETTAVSPDRLRNYILGEAGWVRVGSRTKQILEEH